MVSYESQIHCHHPFNEDGWKSPVKIMLLNVSFICCTTGGGCGINNLWNQKSSCSRVNWSGIWISLSLILCLLALPIAEARPSPGPATVPRAVRDHTRHFILSSSSTGAIGHATQKQFNSEPNSGTDTLSLSVFSPLDILRQNMLLEIQRKRMRHAKQQQVHLNKVYLDRIGR